MRTHVTFRYPAEFIAVSSEDGILAVAGAKWFVSLLARIPELQIAQELCQEDWGVVVFARRLRKKFWIGLSVWPEGEHTWLAHFHHSSFAWLQRFGSSGNKELSRLLSDVHEILSNEPRVTDISWYEQCQLNTPQPAGFPVPFNS